MTGPYRRRRSASTPFTYVAQSFSSRVLGTHTQAGSKKGVARHKLDKEHGTLPLVCSCVARSTGKGAELF